MKNILVTGGARGIGKGIIEELANIDDVTILLNYNKSESEAMSIERELKKRGICIFKYKATVCNYEEVKSMIRYFEKQVGYINVLINNSGISQIKLFTDISIDDWNNMMNTNINSMFYVTKEVVPKMIYNKDGCIINISSIWGITGGSCEVHYSASKGAVNAFTKALAKELGPSNIRVNAIAPGFIETDMNKSISIQDKDIVIEETPLERTGNVLDIAKCAKWLIEDNFTTGQIISINGGLYI